MPEITSVTSKQKDARARITATKWKALKKRGLVKPKNTEENQKRLREAHGY